MAPTSTANETVAPTSRLHAVAPLLICQNLIADGKLEEAKRCLAAEENDDTPDGRRAKAMRALLVAWTESAAPAATVEADVAPTSGTADLMGLVDSGAAEALVHGTIAGGVGGFLVAATGFSITRHSEKDSLPWLIAAPAAGAVGGAAGAYLLLDSVEATPGDIALSTSTMWMGLAEGFVLQLAVFDQSRDVGAVPLRFATIFGGGALGLAAGAGLSPLVDVTPGDVAVANSAGLWGAVLSGFGVSWIVQSGSPLTFSQGTLIVGAGALLPYAAALALHPQLEIDRAPSWLIEAGGVGGFLTTSAGLVVLSTNGGMDGRTATAFLGVGTAAGVAAGYAAAWLVSEGLKEGAE